MEKNEIILKLLALMGKGCLAEHNYYSITLREWSGNPILEIIYYNDEDILISNEKGYAWCNKIKRIADVRGRLYIKYTVVRNGVPAEGLFRV